MALLWHGCGRWLPLAAAAAPPHPTPSPRWGEGLDVLQPCGHLLHAALRGQGLIDVNIAGNVLPSPRRGEELGKRGKSAATWVPSWLQRPTQLALRPLTPTPLPAGVRGSLFLSPAIHLLLYPLRGDRLVDLNATGSVLPSPRRGEGSGMRVRSAATWVPSWLQRPTQLALRPLTPTPLPAGARGSFGLSALPVTCPQFPFVRGAQSC